MAATGPGSLLSFQGKPEEPGENSFPFVAWAVPLFSKGSATSAREQRGGVCVWGVGGDLGEAVECAFAQGFSFQL